MADLEELFDSALEHHRAGSLIAAENLYRELLRYRPGHVGVLANLGAVLDGLGRFDEAIATYRLGLALAPKNAALHNNLGNVLKEMGALEAAAEHYRQAISAEPDNAEAHNNLGAVLQGLGHLRDAERCYKRALSLKPDYVQALDNLGDVLHVQDRIADARECFERVLRLAPNDGVRLKLALLIPPVYESIEEIEANRKHLAEAVEAALAKPIVLSDPVREVNTVPFYLAFHGRNDRELAGKIAQLFRPALPESLVPPRPRKHPRPRIGFVSAFWHNHPVGARYGRLVKRIAARDFGVTVFAANASPVPRSFAEDERLQVVRLPANLGVARRMVADRGLDILVYTDIGMEPLTYYLAFTRLAPVQCLLPGHPVTSGIPTIDYFISSALAEPEGAEAHYSEILLRLPTLTEMFERPEMPAHPKGRAALGLPAGRLYVCPVLPFKLHPAFDALLKQVLERDRQGRIVLFRDPRDRGYERAVKQRFARTLGPLAERIDFLPFQAFEDFLSVLLAADALLDSHPFSAGASVYAALGLGIPIVTLPSDFLRGRTALGCYRQMGIEDCIAKSAAHYAEIAVRLAGDPGLRSRLRDAIEAKSADLFGNEACADALAAFFRRVAARPEAAE